MMVHFLFHDNHRYWLSPRFSHVNMLANYGNVWLFCYYDQFQLHIKPMDLKNVANWDLWYGRQTTLREALCVDIVKSKKASVKPFLPTCNEIMRLLSGIQVGFTFNPVHLYTKILKYNHLKNYSLINSWKRHDGIR